jgi:uncharacterized membrane protein
MDQKKINQSEWENPDNWSMGLYFSKKDNRTWVPKQILWMGWTLNLGTKSGALWMIGLLIGIPVSIVLIVLIVFPN